jgi:hypothetical protein
MDQICVMIQGQLEHTRHVKQLVDLYLIAESSAGSNAIASHFQSEGVHAILVSGQASSRLVA